MVGIVRDMLPLELGVKYEGFFVDGMFRRVGRGWRVCTVVRL